jgi:hypothetical protein
MSRRLLAALVLLFLATVVVRFPARWALGLAPQGISCEIATGSAWQGSCLGLQAGGLHVDAFDWQLHPLALLRARLAASVQARDARINARGDVELGTGGRIAVHAFSATFPLEATPLPILPRGWLGRAQVELDSALLTNGRPSALAGTIALRSLRQLSPPLEFGNYTLRFATPPDADGRQRGELADAGGPLAINGTVTLGKGGQYEVEGMAAAREGAAPELARMLELLGPADDAGRRPFSVAGTF